MESDNNKKNGKRSRNDAPHPAQATQQRGESDSNINPNTSMNQLFRNEAIGRPLLSPSHQDIICGRGLHITSHLGNIKLHNLVKQHRRKYLHSSRQEKATMIKQIVDEIKSTGSKFIQRVQDGRDDEWMEVDEETAYNKVGHALRRKPNKKKEKRPRPQSEVQGQPATAGIDSTMPPPPAVPLNSAMFLHAQNLGAQPSIPAQFLLGNQLYSVGSQLVLQPPPPIPTVISQGYGLLLNNIYFASAFNAILATMMQPPPQQQHQPLIPSPLQQQQPPPPAPQLQQLQQQQVQRQYYDRRAQTTNTATSSSSSSSSDHEDDESSYI